MPRSREKNGKDLEETVRRIEHACRMGGGHSASDLKVECRKLMRDREGIEAEIDLLVSFRFSSAETTICIECRDRRQPQGAAWIEQLIGRRARFGFSNIIAVSSSGFSKHALALAKAHNIQTRRLSRCSSLADQIGFTESKLCIAQAPFGIVPKELALPPGLRLNRAQSAAMESGLPQLLQLEEWQAPVPTEEALMAAIKIYLVSEDGPDKSRFSFGFVKQGGALVYSTPSEVKVPFRKLLWEISGIRRKFLAPVLHFFSYTDELAEEGASLIGTVRSTFHTERGEAVFESHFKDGKLVAAELLGGSARFLGNPAVHFNPPLRLRV